MNMQQQNDDNKFVWNTSFQSGTSTRLDKHLLKPWLWLVDKSSREYLCQIRYPGEHASGSDVGEIARGTARERTWPRVREFLPLESLPKIEPDGKWSSRFFALLKVAYYSFIRVQEVHSINVQIFFFFLINIVITNKNPCICLLYTSPSPRDA